MTTFDGLESSTESSRPLEIYQVILGSTTFNWTSAAAAIEIDSVTYLPIPGLQRTEAEKSRESYNRGITITLSSDNSLATRFRNVIPGQKATVNIWRLQRDESPAFNTRTLEFKGHAVDIRFPNSGYTAELVCKSAESALNRTMPRYSFTGVCGHIVYGPGCGVDSTGFGLVGTVTDVDGSTITLDGANAFDDGFFTGGYVRTTSGDADFRLVIAHAGNDLTLLLPFPMNVDGASLQVFAGCDHIITSDCVSKFANTPEHGGFAFIPDRNVFRDGLPKT